ncbi:MAG: 4Fe-4S binding protein [Lentimicrobium sp.]|nr:4Fe-4S binding protein [Lentimicrobium sp.]
MHSLYWLRFLRIVVSLFFLLLTSLIFLDPAQWIPGWFTSAVVWPQFAPSVVRFTVSAGLAASGFLLFTLLALLFGRVYCSSICPIGTLQDIISWFKKLFFKTKPLKFARPQNILRYSILALVIISFVFGISLLVNLLDPYSNFGRIMTNLVRPLFLAGGNVLANVLEKNDIFWMPKTTFKLFHASSVGFASGFLLLIGWMSFVRGRLFCNTICPVGSLLGIFSRFAIFKISIDKMACNSCGQCSKVCKAQCINVKHKEVDFSRCVACYNCLDVCPSNGVLYNLNNISLNAKTERNPLKKDKDRRTILKALMIFSAFATTRAFATRTTGGEKPTEIPEEKQNIASPPGSLGHSHFTKKCTACHLCVSICPTHVLQPSFLQYGLHGLMQPYMDYHSGFCNFDCTLCSEICPTGAIKNIAPDDKKLAQLGIAKFIEKNCVVYTDNTDCGACSEHCPTKAVNMVPYKGALTIPLVNEKICIGCGACEYACPTKPYRAIFVEGNILHIKADEPVQDEIVIEKTEEDFPF